MTKETKNAMRRIKRKLEKAICLHTTACGHEENVREALNAEFDLIEIIQAELEKRDEARASFLRAFGDEK